MKSKTLNALIISLFTLSILFSVESFAQERKVEFIGGMGVGSSSFINYSPVSSLGNVNDVSNSFLYYINLGFNFNQKVGLDLKLRVNQSNFIQDNGLGNILEEQSSLVYFGINPKVIFPITNKVDIIPFIGIGGLFQGSKIDLKGSSYTPTRFGLATNLGLSVNYELTSMFYVSATIETLVGNLKKSELPNALETFRNNNLNRLNSYDFSFSFNIKL